MKRAVNVKRAMNVKRTMNGLNIGRISQEMAIYTGDWEKTEQGRGPFYKTLSLPQLFVWLGLIRRIGRCIDRTVLIALIMKRTMNIKRAKKLLIDYEKSHEFEKSHEWIKHSKNQSGDGHIQGWLREDRTRSRTILQNPFFSPTIRLGRSHLVRFPNPLYEVAFKSVGESD